MVGTSGSGKSTLASLLVRFWEPQRGNITLGDIPLAQYPKEQLRQLIGVVEQDTFLFSATVRENLRLACPDATEQQLEQALAFAELTDVIAALPEGLDTALGDNGYRLSGGQRQRLALARHGCGIAPLWCWMRFFRAWMCALPVSCGDVSPSGERPHAALYHPQSAKSGATGLHLCIGTGNSHRTGYSADIIATRGQDILSDVAVGAAANWRCCGFR